MLGHTFSCKLRHMILEQPHLSLDKFNWNGTLHVYKLQQV